MTSVLASQLQALARQRQPTLPTAARKGKPSLLFAFQKAADIDLQTIYGVACQGLEDLTRLEPRFRPYRESLFSRSSLDLNADQQASEFLLKLNESIHSFCCLLSNHFLLPPTFKVLEYLIRRYKANERNVDSLMTAALPYHSTNEFVRLVQTLSLGAPGSLWGWLSKMQITGASLPRDLLAQRCINDRQLLLFICKAARQLGGAAGSGAFSLRLHSRTFLSFYAVLLCEVLAVLPEVNEDFLAALLPHLLEGLGRGAAQDYRAATLMAVAELFTRATLGKEFIKVLLNTMLKHTEPVPEHVRTVLLVMAHMAVTQLHIRYLSDKTLRYLSALPNVAMELAALAQRGNIRACPLLLLIVNSLATSLVSAAGDGRSTGRCCEGDLLALAHSRALRGKPACALASALLASGGSAKADSVLREKCQRILRVLDQRYPESTDEAVNIFLEPLRTQRQLHQKAACSGAGPMDTGGKRHKTRSVKTGGASSVVHDDNDDGVHESAEAAVVGLSLEERTRFDFVRATFMSGGYSAPCGGTMLTVAAALAAPQAAVRRMALQQLDADLAASVSFPPSETGSDSAHEARAARTAAALNCLRDDDLGVVVAALGLSCLKDLPPAVLMGALVPLSHRLGEFLFATTRLPQMKAARRAARKVLDLLCHLGAASPSEEIKLAVALHILELMQPSERDTAVAIAAARAAANVGVPLFSGLDEAMDKVESQLKVLDADAIRQIASKGKEVAEKKAVQKKAAALVERNIVSALAKALTTDPSICSDFVKRVVAASADAAVSCSDAARAASRRAQHVLLLAALAAAASPTTSTNLFYGATRQSLQFLVDLAETLLPYARLNSCDYDWRTVFLEHIPATGLPSDEHSTAFLNDPASSHSFLILGALQSSLSRLPEVSADGEAAASQKATTARRVLEQLASLGYPLGGLRDVPQLVVTRSVNAVERSAFLSDLYTAPAASAGDAAAPCDAPLQCLALHVQSKLATVGSVASWLVTLLPALASSEASVRSAACDCLAVVSVLFTAASDSGASFSSVPSGLPYPAASVLCSALLAHREIVCRDPDATVVLLQEALHAGFEPAATGGAKGAKRDSATARLLLPAPVATAASSYLISSLQSLGVDAAGVNTACVVLSCLVPMPVVTVAAVDSQLLSAGTTYLARLISRLRSTPTSATFLDAKAVGLLTNLLFSPATVSAAAVAQRESALGCLAEAAELLPSPGSAQVPTAVAALAAMRLLALRQVSPELVAALPGNSRAVRELLAVLLGRHECDPNDEVRAVARSVLETIPLTAELLVPLLDRPAALTPAHAPVSSSPDGRAKKKSKKEAKAVDVTAGTVDPMPVPPPLDVSSAALRDAVSVLELLQWRTGISSAHLLVTACQSLLRRLLPVVGSIASVLKAEGNAGAGEVGDDEDAKSSLAGYASTLALQALAALARDETLREVQMFDLQLAVRAAREAPDSSVRNAALGLLATLATRMPEAALSHVLQVLAVVNRLAALQDDEHSRAVGATALAAVVPAWVAAGRRPSALWEPVVSSLPALPAHRRLGVMLALLRAMPEVHQGLSDGLFVMLQHTLEPKAANIGMPEPTPVADKEQQPRPLSNCAGTEAPSEWLPELASQLALQVELPQRLACLAHVMEMALSASGQQAHKALPRAVVVFVTAQLKLKIAVAAASASFRRPEPEQLLDMGCRRLMEAALAQMQLLQPDASSAAPPSAKSCGARRAVLAASRGLYGIFAALKGVMAADTYLQSLLTLAEHPADKVKRRALKLFTDKVRGVRSEIQDQIELPQRVRNAKLRQASDAAARACAMLPPLLQTSSSDAASPLTRQLALVALAAIATEFGSQQHATLLAAVPAVLSSTRDPHASIRASALATVAAFVQALKAQLVPVLPSTLSAAVAAADSACARLALAGVVVNGGQDTAMVDAATDDAPSYSEEDSDDGAAEPRRLRRGSRAEAEDAALELSSALACLNALVETLGGFLSPHLSSILGILFNPRVLVCEFAGCDKFAASIRGRLPTALPPRLLLPALYERLEPCLASAEESALGAAVAAAAPTVALLNMVGETAAALESKMAVQYCEAIFVFLLRALDVRHRRPKALAAHGDMAIDAVEAAAIGATVALVMKLSETRFKPLFLRLLEWASMVTISEAPGSGGEPSYMGRMVVMFGVVNALADRLRSVLVPYYKYLVELCVQHLSEESMGGKARRGKKPRRSIATVTADMATDMATEIEQQHRLAWLLRLRIVRALHRCFLHDSVGFVDAERFARLQDPLVSQLAAEPPDVVVPYLLAPQHTDTELSAYVSLGAATRSYTAPDGAASMGPLGAASIGCLLAMAVAANSDVLWKPLNHATLMMTRSSNTRTRALALELIAQLVDRLNEEYLVLLPEALPFFSELLEDMDAAVAARVREVILKLEDISGEKLDEYLRV